MPDAMQPDYVEDVTPRETASLTASCGDAPRRLVLTCATTGDELEAQFNPRELTEQLGASWTAVTVPGASHQPLQFSHTENFKIRLDLVFVAVSKSELAALQRARLLLFGWCHPRRVSNDIVGGAAPRILVTWPGMLSMETVLRNVEMKHQRFNRLGQSVHFVASVQFEEIGETQLYCDGVVVDESLRFGNPLEQEEGWE